MNEEGKKGRVMTKSTRKKKGNPNISIPHFPSVLSTTPVMAFCPRCGERYDANKPVERCRFCNLKLGEKDNQGRIEWSKEFEEAIPDFVFKPLNNIELFYKSIRWHYNKWMKAFRENPSYR